MKKTLPLSIRILIADDHALVRQGLRQSLEARAGWAVCAEVDNGSEAVEKAALLRPDVALLDMTMPVLNGIDATRQILKVSPGTRVMLLTMHASEMLEVAAREAGAMAFVLKQDPVSVVIRGIQMLLENRSFYPTSRWGDEFPIPRAGGTAGGAEMMSEVRSELTPREREVIQAVAEGLSSKEIADRLKMSVKTVEQHRSNIFRKLGVRSLAGMVRYAIRNHLSEP